ncbi:hypothetical protein QTI66_00675 [Variovorax sp. J22R133]|uniref:DUF7660 family protein n=1 Tax=Variovorax brevis TaxID=3053503 RepID=UPI002577D8D7|nr:hypothetical protein [Variovorax sp. J22R133]MDM0110638.1 hypothetical protein [Variovorax sp. J22R133]
MDKLISDMKNKDDFLVFLKALVADLRSNESTWENKTLESYFEGLSGWVEGMEGYYANNGIKNIDLKRVSWRIFADMLLSAKYYE